MSNFNDENEHAEGEVPEEDNGPDNTVVSGQTPGQMLAQARKQKNLELDDVSTQLHLSRSVVEALESDDYHDLGEPVYVRGYLRRCACLLDLSAEEVLRAHEATGGAPSPGPSRPHVVSADEPLYPSRNWLPLLILVVVGCLLVAAIIWWTSKPVQAPGTQRSGTGQHAQGNTLGTKNQSPSDNGKPASAPAGAEQQSSVPLIQMTPSGGKNQNLQAAPAEHGKKSSGKKESGKESPGIVLHGENTQQSVGSKAGNVRKSVPQQGDETSKPRAASSKSGKSAASADDDGKSGTAAASEAVLHLSFDHACWVNIHDSRGKTLMLAAAQAGESKELHGQPPFRIVLGYAPGVTLSLNGKPVDISQHAGGKGVARFTLGKPAGD